MRPRDMVGLGLVALVAATPSYFVERLTEYYILSGNSTWLFVWSSFLTPLFITLVLVTAVESGYAVRNIRATVDRAVSSVTFSYSQ